MSFRDQMSNDVANVFLNLNEFGENVIYTPDGGSGRTIVAIVEREEAAEIDQQDGRGVGRAARLHIAADAANGIASPGIGDQATFDGLDWTVRGVESDGAGMHVLRVDHFASTEKSRQGYRLGRE